MKAAEAEHNTARERELLERVLALDPAQFESLVVRLLETLDYARLGRAQRTGRSGDRGIDGFAVQDPLGFEVIHMQAKRYTENAVHRPEIQQFAGAIRGERGVFVTSSTFSQGAREEASRESSRIRLIDGQRLAELMLAHGIGVEPEVTATLYRVNEDFFEALG